METNETGGAFDGRGTRADESANDSVGSQWEVREGVCVPAPGLLSLRDSQLRLFLRVSPSPPVCSQKPRNDRVWGLRIKGNCTGRAMGVRSGSDYES